MQTAYKFLPLVFSAGIFDRLRGFADLSLDEKGVSCTSEGVSTRVDFADVVQIESDGNALSFVCSDLRKVCVRFPKRNQEAATLVQRLYAEFGQYCEFFRQLENLGPEENFSRFVKCFSFLGQPYVRALDFLIAFSAQDNFSDIHFEPLAEMVKITFRCRGRVVCPGELPLSFYQRLLARIKFLSGCLTHVDDKAQEGAFRDERTGSDIRVSCFPTDLGERLSLRFIQALRFKTLDDLGWQPQALALWRRMLSSPSGLFIISGQVGSGKTTAMYAGLSELANRDAQLRVVTIEDPVEARIAGICQSSLDSMKDLGLAQAFKHMLRQDPDVIALGEIRDRECLKEALQAGLSGHRVFATFHAGRGSETIARIKQMGVEDYLVLQGLKGIIHLELKYENGQAQAAAEIIDPGAERG